VRPLATPSHYRSVPYATNITQTNMEAPNEEGGGRNKTSEEKPALGNTNSVNYKIIST